MLYNDNNVHLLFMKTILTFVIYVKLCNLLNMGNKTSVLLKLSGKNQGICFSELSRHPERQARLGTAAWSERDKGRDMV